MAERKPNSTKKQKQVEIHKQRDMCRVESEDGKYGGYKKDILTENLTDREVMLLICDICKGIMREACLTSSGEQFCSCCEVRDPKSPTTKTNSPLLRSKHAKRPSKQTPNIPVRKMVDSLKCSCPLLERGCKWLSTLEECEEHLDTCGHVRDQCKLGCGAVLQRNELRVHEEEGCPLCIVKCKHCKGDFKLNDMPTHLEVCHKMEVSCKLKCNKIMPRQDMAQHLEQECGFVVEMCNLGCGMEMTRNEIKKHLTDTCVQRLMQCEHCQRDVKFCDMPNHLDVCPKMKVSCELTCGVIMCRKDMIQHLKQECGLVVEICKLGCDMKMTRNEIKKHLTDTCVQRLMQCEHCQRDVKFCDMSPHLDVCPKMKVSCELACGVVLCRSKMAQHLKEECGLVVETCKLGCGKMTRDELKIHVTDTCVQRLIQCEHCQRDVKFCDMPNHLEVCPQMEVSCELTCGVIMCRKDMIQHLKQECGLVVEICKLGCDMKMTRNEIKKHLTDTCVQRLIQCEHCQRDVKFCDMPNHLEVCPQMEVSCELTCGVIMCRKDMTQHLEKECGLMVETCKLGCDMKMTRDELKIHVTDTCVLRLIRCEHCQRDVNFCDMPNHMDACPKMEVSCELACGVIMCREDLNHHLEELCPEKDLACPFVKYSCEVGLLKRKYLSQHLEEKRIEHLELKLNAMEEIILKQSEESKQYREEIRHLKLKLTRLENSFSPITTKCQEELTKQMMTINLNKLSEQINTLCSLNNTTKIEWKIGDITEFIKTVHLPQKHELLSGDILKTYFLKNSICVSFGHKHGSHQTTVIAKFTICLYSNTEMKVMKQYIHETSQFLIGDVKREIAPIPNSDFQELSRIGATDIFLKMYVTIM